MYECYIVLAKSLVVGGGAISAEIAGVLWVVAGLIIVGMVYLINRRLG